MGQLLYFLLPRRKLSGRCEKLKRIFIAQDAILPYKHSHIFSAASVWSFFVVRPSKYRHTAQEIKREREMQREERIKEQTKEIE